ncbi:hypothetical protein [Glutamicibacter protophormiae]|uniref:hypothetical protein n=1 Tax=Glutamicibacter protophormiae TaxID=37930 RepID=UPI003A924030
MNLTAKELSGKHIGKTITVEYRRSTVTGELDKIEHEREITASDWGGNPAAYQYWATLTIGGIVQNAIGGNTPITIQED